MRVTKPVSENGQWQVFYYNTHTSKHCRLSADFLVVCTGLHSTPHVPHIENQELFRGVIAHTRELEELGDDMKVGGAFYDSWHESQTLALFAGL